MKHLLKSAIDLQKVICNTPDHPLSGEFDARTSPILWFGELTTSASDYEEVRRDKGIILTVGANPSWREYHKVKSTTLLSNFRLSRLVNPSNYKDILKGFNEYFTKNPYSGWFGKIHGGKVEALVNGMNAGFYGSKAYQAVHIDLFPFATKDVYTKVKSEVESSIIATGWAPRLFEDLVTKINPVKIVVFGKTNVQTLCNYYDTSLHINGWKSFQIGNGRTANYCHGKLWGKYDLRCIDVNAGNAIGFSAADLNNLGKLL